jgi:FAD/FMN-containing dehydrogenase
MGRSYGDTGLNDNVLLTRRFNKILQFDPVEGIVTCESGVTLAEIIETFLPKGWFLSVTPGTRFVTVGGALAGDVHGKNHHSHGCFSECVIFFELMLPGGEVLLCSRVENSELFHATCGGIGLTGVILNVTFRLSPVRSGYIRETVIRCRNLEEVFHRFEEYGRAAYSVAWIDCLAKGHEQGRSVLMLGEAAEKGPLEFHPSKTLSVPLDFPGFCLNTWSVSLFNHFYYDSHPDFTEGRLTPLDKFFYPLDAIRGWNRIYGRRGFCQYQLVLPKEASRPGLLKILTRISDSGMGSFLAVLKLLGRQNANPLSFPMEGYTLALDFKVETKLFPLLDELDRIVLDYGGRLYLSKDSRMSAEVFRRGYPQWERFAELRDRYGMNKKFNSLQSIRLGV